MNKNKQKQGNSMFLYTALIFLVALILIMISFFGKINRPKHSAPPAPTESAETIKAEDIEALNSELSTYESLVKANSYTAYGKYEEAAEEIKDINADSLTEEQKVLYEQITAKINAGKDQ